MTPEQMAAQAAREKQQRLEAARKQFCELAKRHAADGDDPTRAEVEPVLTAANIGWPAYQAAVKARKEIDALQEELSTLPALREERGELTAAIQEAEEKKRRDDEQYDEWHKANKRRLEILSANINRLQNDTRQKLFELCDEEDLRRTYDVAHDRQRRLQTSCHRIEQERTDARSKANATRIKVENDELEKRGGFLSDEFTKRVAKRKGELVEAERSLGEVEKRLAAEEAELTKADEAVAAARDAMVNF